MPLVVHVPATAANLGPGFDVLGVAVSVFNRFAFEPCAPGRFLADGAPVEPESHLTLHTAVEAGRAFGGRIDGLSVSQTEDVPRSRGLGSSATARVAGVLAWSHYSGLRPAQTELLAFLAEQEGHPDNVVPAMVGGLTACTTVDGALRHLRFDPPDDLEVALCVPPYEVETAAARRALPVSVPHDAAVFNAGRMAFLLAGLRDGDPDALAVGLDDRLHQPYRAALIGPVDEAFAAARAAGAIGAFISGSGSTLAAFVPAGVHTLAVAQAMAGAFGAAGCDCRVARPVAAGASAVEQP